MKTSYFVWNLTFTTTKLMAYLLLPYSAICTFIVKDAMIPITAMGAITALLGVNKYAEVKLNKIQNDEVRS